MQFFIKLKQPRVFQKELQKVEFPHPSAERNARPKQAGRQMHQGYGSRRKPTLSFTWY
jgi:hypothetical protein